MVTPILRPARLTFSAMRTEASRLSAVQKSASCSPKALRMLVWQRSGGRPR